MRISGSGLHTALSHLDLLGNGNVLDIGEIYKLYHCWKCHQAGILIFSFINTAAQCL